MKTPRRSYRSFRSARSKLRHFFAALSVVLATVLCAPLAEAGVKTWSGAVSGSWANVSNWGGGIPTTSDTAVFTGTIAMQPTLGPVSNTTANGIWATALAQDVLISASGSRTLTLSANAANGGVAILLDDVANHSLTTATNVTVSVTQNSSFLVNNSGTLALSGTLKIGPGKTLTLGGTNTAGNIVISGNINNPAGNTGAINVNTAGTVTLSGSNVFTGTLTVTSGTLKATNSVANLGGGPLILNGGALWLADTVGQNYNSSTTVSADSQILSDAASPGSAGLTYSFGTLSVRNTLTISGGSNVTSGTAGVTFSGDATLDGTTTFKIVKPKGGGTTLLTVGAISDLGSSVTLDGDGNFAQTGAFGASSGGLITASSFSGTATLSQNNTFSGGFTLNGGAVVATVQNALGKGAVLLNGGALVLSSVNPAFSRDVTVGGNTEMVSDLTTVGTGATYTFGALASSSGNHTLKITGGSNVNAGTAGITFGATTLGGNLTFNIVNPIAGGSTTLTVGAIDGGTSDVTLDGNGKFVQTGVWSGSGGLTLSSNYTGSVTLNQLNTFTGGVTVGGGALTLSGSSNSRGITINGGLTTLGTGSGIGQDSAYVAFGAASSGTLRLSGLDLTIGSLTGASTTSVIENNATSGTCTLTVNNSTQDAYAGILRNNTGVLALIKGGTGTLSLTGTNTFTGTLTLNGGVLNANTAGINGSSVVNGIVFDGGALKAGVGGINTAKTVMLLSNGTIDTNGSDSVLSGTISGVGSLTKEGGGSLTLSVNNNFSGGVIINSGTLKPGTTGALGLGDVTFGTSNAPTLDINGLTLTTGLLSGLGSNGIVTNSGFARNLVLSGTGTKSYAGVIQNGTGASTMGLQKTDSGTQILNGYVTNNYSGVTAVTGGTLLLDFVNMSTPTNLISGSSALTLGGGALSIKGLAGSGTTTQTFGTFTTQANSGSYITLDPNNGAGTILTLGDSWARGAGSTLVIDYSSLSSGDRRIVTAGATTTGTITNGIYGWALVKDSGGTGFATRAAGSNQAITRYDDTTGTTLAIASAGATTNYTTLNSTYDGTGTLKWNNVGALTNRSVNSLTIDTSKSGGTIDMGITTGTLTLTSGAILFRGGSNAILKGGRIGALNADVIIHQISTSGTLTVDSLIGSGSGRLIKDGAGALVLTGSSGSAAGAGYTGGTDIYDGVLQISGSNNLGGGTVTLNGGTLRTVISGTLEINRAFAANGTGGTVEIVGGVLVAGTTSMASNLNILGSGGLIFKGAVSGAGGLTFSSAYSGTATLDQVNTFTGGLTINNGTVKATGTSALGLNNEANAVQLGGGTLVLSTSSSYNFGRNVTVNGNSKITADTLATSGSGNIYTLGALYIGAQTLTIAGGSGATSAGVTSGTAGITFGKVNLGGDATFNLVNPVGGGFTMLTVGAITDDGHRLTLTGTGGFAQTAAWGVGGGGGLTLGSTYSGTATLNQQNLYTGETRVGGGLLVVGAVGALSTDSAMTVAGGTLSIGTFSNTVASLTLQGGAITGSTGVLTSVSAINVQSGSIGAIIASSAGLTKTTSGTAWIGGNNTNLSGPITVMGGVLNAMAPFALGNNNAPWFLGGGELQLANDASSSNTGRTITVTGTSQLTLQRLTSGTGTIMTTGTLNLGGKLTVAGGSLVNSGTAGLVVGTTNLTDNSTINFIKSPGATTSLTVGVVNDAGYTLTLSGAGNFAQTAAWAPGLGGGLTLAANYSGTAVLNQNNQYSGITTINGGTLVVVASNGSALGQSEATNALTFGGGNLVLSSSSVSLTIHRNTVVTENAQITSDVVGTSGTGATFTLANLVIGNQTLTIAGGPNVTSGTAGISFYIGDRTTLVGNATFNIVNPATAGTAITVLTLAAITNGTNNITLTGNGNFAQSAVWGNGSGGLILVPGYSGTATLNQANTFTGSVTVGGGQLNLNGTSRANGIKITGGTTTLGVATGLGQTTGGIAFGGAGTAGKLQLNGFNVTIASLSGSSASSVIENGSAKNITVTIADVPQMQSSYAGVLTDGTAGGTLSLTKAGNGLLTLTGANTYTGLLTLSGGILNATTAGINGSNLTAGITMNGGTLQAGNGGISTAKNIAVSGVSAFDTNGNASLLSGVISGSGIFRKIGANTLTLSGVNTYSGVFSIDGGILAINSAANLGASNATVSMNGGTLESTGNSYSLTQAITINGAGTIQVDSGTLTTGNIFGGGLLTKSGAGLLNLAGSGSSFSGGLTINVGAVQVGHVNAMGSGNITFAGAGTVLDLNGKSPVTGLLVSSGNKGIVTNGSATAATLTLNGAGTQSFSGLIQNGLGVIGLTKAGVGTQILNGNVANTYTGATTINGGTLKLDFSNFATAANLVNAGSALVFADGTLSILGHATNATTQTFASLTANGGAASIILTPRGGVSTRLVITNNSINRTAGSTINFDTSAAAGASTATVAWNPGLTNGLIGGAYTVTDSAGTGFATVSGGNVVAMSGSTALAATSDSATTNFTTNPSSGYTGGVLTLSSSGTHATNSLTVVASANGALDLGGQNLTFASGGLLMTGASDFTITTGTLGASAKELIIHQFGLGTLTVGSQISGSTGSLTKDGSGLLVLSGSNSYTGLTTIDGGTIKIAQSNNLGTGAIVLNRGTLEVSTGGFDLGRALTAGGSGGTLQVDSGTLTESGLVTINSGLTVQGAGNTILTGTISGLGILTKAGAGTLTLQNSSVNTAGLVITSGTVMLGADATISNAAGVDISGNSTLDLAGYNFTLSSASATSVTFGAGTQLFNSGAALAKFNGITSGFTVNFTGGRIGGQEVWIGSNATNFTLNVMAGFGGGALYLGNTASASTINLNLSGTGTFNLGATLETRTVVGSQLKNALNLTIANTVSEFSGGAILSSSYATANPLGTRDIYTTADNSLTFASGTGTFLLSGGTIDVRSAANTAAAGIIVTNGNTLVIGGGNLLGNSLASTTGAIALQSGNLMLRNAGVSGVANFTISDAPGNDGRTIQMSGSTGTFTAATSINPGYFIIGSQADGGTWNRGTLNSGSNYSIVGDASGNSAFANVTSLFTISDNSGFSGLVMGSGSIPALLNLGVNSTFFALSSNAPSRTYNVGVGAGNNIATAATGGFVFGVNDSNVDSTQIINLNRDKGDGNVTLLTNGASLSNAINLNATQTGTGNLYIATRNLTLNAGVTFGGTGGIFTDLNPGNGQLESALGNGAGDFNGSGNVDVLFTINGIMNGLNTVYLNGDNPAAGSTLDSGITLGSTAVVGGTQTWTVHQGIADAVAFGNAQQMPGNWTNGSVSLTNSGNYGTFEAATNSSAPSLASNYRFNSIVLNPTAATGQYKLVNNVYNDGGTAKEGLFASSFAFSVSDNNAGRYTFSLNGQDLYVDRFSNFASANAPGLILMNDVANSTSSIRAVGTASDVLSIGSFYAINGSTLEIAGGSYNNMIAYRNGSALPGDTAAAPNSVSNLTTVGYDGANNLTPGANISFLGSGANSGTNAYTTAKGTGGTVRIVGGKMTSNSYILNPVGTVGLIDTTSVSGGDTTLNNVTIRASSAQSLSGIDIVGNTFTPTVAGVYSDGDVVRFTATTSLPGGLLANTIYYVRDTNLATGAFSVSLTPGGAAVALSSPGVGTITVQDWSGASDATQHSALVVGGTTTINGNLVFANAPGAVNQSTLRVGAVNPQQATVYNPSIYTSATTSVLVAGAGYMVGTSDVIVSFTTGNGQAGTVSGKATANASGQITALTINVGTATIPIDLLTTFGTITSGGVTSGTAGVLKSLTGDQGNPLVYVANAGQTNSTAVLNVTGDLSVGSTNNLAIQSNATVRVGGNVDILGVGQNQVMLITGAGVGINAASTFTLNGNKGAAAPQTVNIVPTLGKFHVGDGNAGVLTGVAAQAKLTGNLTVAGTADINGASSSLNLNGKTMTLLGASPMTVGGTLSVGTVIRGALSGSVNVLNQGKVTGNGSISGQLTVQSGATIAPGDATTGKGTLTAGDLTLNDNVNISLAITKDASGVAGTDYGQLSVGALHLDGISQINLSLQNVFGDGSIFDSSATHLVWASVITSTDLTGFSSSQFNIDSSSLTGVLAGAGHFMMVQNASNHNVLDLEYMAIPEPQTWAMLLGGVGLLGVIQRARRRIQS